MTITNKKCAKGPCKECPFRVKSLPGWLGGGIFGQAKDYLKLAKSNSNIGCHCSPGFSIEDANRTSPCAGLAIFRNNIGHTPKHPQAAEACKTVNAVDDNVLKSEDDFITHHTKFALKYSDKESVKQAFPRAVSRLNEIESSPYFKQYMIWLQQGMDNPIACGKSENEAWTNAKEICINLELMKW